MSDGQYLRSGAAICVLCAQCGCIGIVYSPEDCLRQYFEFGLRRLVLDPEQSGGHGESRGRAQAIARLQPPVRTSGGLARAGCQLPGDRLRRRRPDSQHQADPSRLVLRRRRSLRAAAFGGRRWSQIHPRFPSRCGSAGESFRRRDRPRLSQPELDPAGAGAHQQGGQAGCADQSRVAGARGFRISRPTSGITRSCMRGTCCATISAMAA